MTSSEQPANGPATGTESDSAPQADPAQQPAKKHGDPLLDEAGAGGPEDAEGRTGAASD